MSKGKWEVRKLGDLCTIQLGKTPYRKDSKLWDKTKSSNNIWLSIADLRHGERIYDGTEYISDAGADNMTIIPKDTILLSFKLTLGRVSFAGTDLYTNEAIASLLNLNKVISKEFLFYYFTFFDWDKAAEGDIKVKGKTLNKRKLQDLPILFPSITEQQRIVSLLDEAFEAIDQAKANAEKNLENAKELFESQLNSLMDTGKSKLGHGWTEKRLKDISLTFGRGKSKHRPRNWKGLYGGEYPFIQTGDVRNANKLVTSFTQTYNETGLNQSKLWKKGTICITIAANIAETGILDFDACFPDSIIGLEVNPEIANLHFTYYVLQYFKNELQELGKGSAQANINLGTFENQLFPFPISIDEQMKIVDKLDFMYQETNKLKTIYLNKINELEELRKSILEKAFNGKL